MITYIFDTLRNNPELAIFLTLSVGYALGKIRLGSFELGSVTGVLLAGIIIGQLDITIAPPDQVHLFHHVPVCRGLWRWPTVCPRHRE